MSSDDKHERLRERERGEQARRILESEIWTEAWQALEAEARAQMEASRAADDEVLEARRMLLTLRKLRRRIERVQETGELAHRQLTEH